MTEVTQLLNRIKQGDRQAVNLLFTLVNDEIHRLATAKLAKEPSGNTLQPSDLVNEVYLRLTGAPDGDRWNHRGHFFAAAAQAMRRILVDSARRRRARKHGGGLKRHDVNDLPIAAPLADEELVAVDAPLNRFAEIEPEKARIVEYRIHLGMTIKETATALGISQATVKRHWTYSKAWLIREMGGTVKNSENL